jgi:radical SAM protein with 4Fe4S-binding SPASM domain
VRVRAEQNLADMEKLWGDLVDQVAFVDYNPWENTYTRPLSHVEAPCSDLWRRLFVWHDGTMNPCDVDYKSTLTVGNARHDRLADVWTGPGYAALRERHAKGLRMMQSPCNRCTVV